MDTNTRRDAVHAIHPVATCPLPPGMAEQGFTNAWAAHVAAGRIGAPTPPTIIAGDRCAGLDRAFGRERSGTGVARAEESWSGGDVPSS